MPGLPTGTVTFLFTDIEGSTDLVQRLGDRKYAHVLTEYRRLLRSAIEEGSGQVIDTQGDAFFVAFQGARDAVIAAVSLQQAIGTYPWPADAPVRVRMGLHTGEPIDTGEAYVGLDVHRAARICAAGHGGQILLSQTTHDLIEHELPPGMILRNLGEHRLKDLQRPERIFQLLHPDLPDIAAPLESLDFFPNNLPVQLTSFIGREREKTEIRNLLENTRLLTLTGIGGGGKTRLALQVAADLLEDFGDGVWFVELAALTDPALVPQQVGSALRLREEPGLPLPDTLVEFLRSRQVLLVLDNCEHLVAACARLAEQLLQVCPDLKILATSRETLGVAGEMTYTVQPLSVPDLRRPQSVEALAHSEAVRLFVERAAFKQVGFRLTNANAQAVAQICHALDGIPFAIELAAARVAVLPVTEIAERLDNRLALLTSGSRTAPPRQQTLQAMLDWSYDLLPEKERILLQRLSVFAGGFTLPAAEAVCAGGGVAAGDVLDLLTHLVNKSLVMVTHQERGDTRYRLLETVRDYVLGKLLDAGEESAVRRHHRNWYAKLTEKAEPMLAGPDETWLDRLEMEHDNLRAAVDFSVKTGDTVAALQLSAALWRFWQVRGYWTEGRQRLEASLAGTDGVPPGLRAKALNGAGALAQSQGDYAVAKSLSEESLTIQRQLGDRHGIASSLTTLGNIAYHKGDYTTARELHEESLAYGRQGGDKHDIAASLINLAIVADHLGDYEQARRLCSESLSLFREVSDKRGIASALNMLGVLASDQGDFATARTLYEESLPIHRDLGNKQGIAAALSNLGLVARERGDLVSARALYEESLVIRRELGHKHGIAATLNHLARVAWKQGDPIQAASSLRESLSMRQALGDKVGIAECLEGLAKVAAEPVRAARWLGAAAALRDALGARSARSDQVEIDGQVGALRQHLGDAAFERAWIEGGEMALDAVVHEAITKV